jgi:hypothetical protein
VVVNRRSGVKATHDIAGLVFRNNVFISDGESLSGPLKKARFEYNAYWSRKAGTVFAGKALADWAKATGQETVDGRLVGLAGDPGISLPEKLELLPKDPQKLGEMTFFRLLPGSKSLGAGVTIQDGGGRDFFGAPLPAGKAPCIGAHEAAK